MPRRTLALTLAALAAGAAIIVAAGKAWPASRVDVPTTPGSALRHAFEAGVDSLIVSLDGLDSAISTGDTIAVQRAFRRSRTSFKRQEALLWMFAPTAMHIANGPLEEDDESPPRPLGAPAVFQRLESRIFGAPVRGADGSSSLEDARYLRAVVAAFRSHMGLIDVSEVQMLDAARVELARVSTLSMAGFDSDESGDAVVESAASLDGLRAMFAVAADQRGSRVPQDEWMALDATLGRAATGLRAEPSVDRADRYSFIAMLARPVGDALMRARVSAGALDSVHRTVWRATAATVFAGDAFDAFAYAPDFAVRATPALLALGARLFKDPRLSGPGSRSCASCHVDSLAFTDGLVRNTALAGSVSRNTPTLVNAALQPAFFFDGRARTLEDQIAAVLASPAEMGSSAEIAVGRIGRDSAYRAEFARIFPDRGADANALRAVLAAYVRSLVHLDSRFDAAIRGDSSALSISERRGFTVFMGKGRCGSCHFAPLFSGTMPPHFTASEPEIIGIPAHPDTAGAHLDPDLGTGRMDAVPQHMHAFKVPTLRNVARTAPYMHNGVYATLAQVVDFYNRGGGQRIGATIPSQTLPARALGLSAQEQRDLIAFLGSLSDSSPLQHAPQ